MVKYAPRQPCRTASQASDALEPCQATTVYREGLDDDSSLFYEGSPRGLVDTGKAWWVQAEALELPLP
jgi:hypothetical protein